MVTEREEDYLKVVHELIEQKGYVRVKDVSKQLDVSPSSVTEMFQRMDDAGYINYEKYGGVTLTDSGTEIAKSTQKKHGVIKDFLEILGVQEKMADEDACKIEHVLTSDTLDTLTKFADFINKNKEAATWLDHFRHYHETGYYIDEYLINTNQCPIHKKKK
ncbi:metal-dependent transcriptional regulator [Methanosalsum natronophilum]|uniref:Metal-dependent transcriptional regulator n=1 Tax=Methanosalsum natronophilum TaxID=768733 RepID=A0A424Z4M4_9EURY|nr:metal-dependent transcriptional regulator [Methanosalsum natronophilum]MCS3924731.1 DtxR family Mn-dependent transcriptional regulator [Methanosalsum natronophilum]RQD92932.1 MAG: metal-dependent transcriptional regulator [Methanosalsum natronophilum]